MLPPAGTARYEEQRLLYSGSKLLWLKAHLEVALVVHGGLLQVALLPRQPVQPDGRPRQVVPAVPQAKVIDWGRGQPVVVQGGGSLAVGAVGRQSSPVREP